jgi:hypothetical protein
LDNSPPLTETLVVLLTLKFHIDCEPIWPDTYWVNFNFVNVSMSDLPDPDTGEVVPLPIHEIDNGFLFIYSSEPGVHLGPGQYPDLWYCESKADIGKTIEFWISNMTKVYGFGFGLVFNYSQKYPDIQSIHFCDAFPPPYEFLDMRVEYDDPAAGLATLIVQLRRPSEKPTVTHQPGPAVTIDFYSTFEEGAWYYPPNYYDIPQKSNTTIYLEWAYVESKCGCTVYDQNYVFPTVTYFNNTNLGQGGRRFPLNWTAANSTIHNYFRPCIGDLNLDGVVDIQDLQALAKIYGLNTATKTLMGAGGLFTWGNLDGQGLPPIVDIFDFVVLAKYFGKPCITCTPESIADP